MLRREKAQTTGVSAGLSKRARKRKRKGEQKDAEIAQSLQDCLNAHPTRSKPNKGEFNMAPPSHKESPIRVKAPRPERLMWDSVEFQPVETSPVVTACTAALNPTGMVKIRSGLSGWMS